MRIAVAMVILNLTLNWILMWPLREAGLAWSTSICAAIQTLVLGAFLGHQLHAPLLDASTRAGLLKTTACAILMSVSVWAASLATGTPESWSRHLLTLSVLCAVGAAAYALSAALLGCHELRWLLHRR